MALDRVLASAKRFTDHYIGGCPEPRKARLTEAQAEALLELGVERELREMGVTNVTPVSEGPGKKKIRIFLLLTTTGRSTEIAQ